ncbi:hypothetical protein CONLIGDRAFT_704418 [Coniochaeta ligniaria NRRL 30616]|uniref:Uncharacterized protein n=1 Tax=Coniochaeta ligniaria NRRL 30616 TaxID=1408157 RepID=A0A1J7IPE0_9PEZI|nr:hypothetical protein CONLIGDRAFT_704418 [Coniochaeta ligniaria NRRL 30616]
MAPPTLSARRRYTTQKSAKVRRKTGKTTRTHKISDTTRTDEVDTSFHTTVDKSTAAKPRRRDVEFWKACREGHLRKVNRLLKVGVNVNTKYYLPEAENDHQLGYETEGDDHNSDARRRDMPRSEGSSTNTEDDVFTEESDVNTSEFEDYTTEEDEPSSQDDDEYDSADDTDLVEVQRIESNKVSALFAAIVMSHFDVAIRLLDEDAIELKSRFWQKGTTPLHEAAARKDGTALVEKFLNRADSHTFIEGTSALGLTALHIAASWGYAEAAKLLLRHGANVNLQGEEDGETPLTMATRAGAPQNVITARLLLVHGADVSIADNDGKFSSKHAARCDTPLHGAAKVNKIGLMEIFIGWGADIEARNKAGETPQDGILPDSDAGRVFKRAHSLKNERQQPWKKGDDFPAICGEFDAVITFFCSRKSAAFKTGTILRPIDDLLYKMAEPGSDNESLTSTPGSPELTELESREEAFYRLHKKRHRPTKREDIWRWIHIPTNNCLANGTRQMTWVRDLAANIGHSYGAERKEDEWYMRNFVEETMFARWERSGDGQARRRSPHVHYSTSPGSFGAQKRVSVVVSTTPQDGELFGGITDFGKIPYLDFETEGYLKRNEFAAESEAFAHMVDLEREYEAEVFDHEGISVGLQRSQTLDESYYGTSDTERDKDQVVYKWFDSMTKTDFHGTRSSANNSGTSASGYIGRQDTTSPKKLLMLVYATYFWKSGSNNTWTETIVTAGQIRWHDGLEFTLDNMIRRSLERDPIWHSPDSLIRHILIQSVRFPEAFEDAGLGHHILDIFESWIARLAHNELVRFKSFQDFIMTTKSQGTRDSASKRETEIDDLSITQEIDLLYETKDVLDELFILRQLFLRQENVASSYCEYERYDSHERSDFLDKCNVLTFIAKTERLDEKSRRVLDSLDRLVQMKLGEVAIIEAQNSTLEAEKSRQLSIYVAFFTIVTIVFTPLSFMTGLFALSIDSFPQTDEGEPRWPLLSVVPPSLIFQIPGIIANEHTTAKITVVGEIVSLLFMVGGLGYLLWRVRAKKSSSPALGGQETRHPRALNLMMTAAAGLLGSAPGGNGKLSASSSIQVRQPGEKAHGRGLRFGLSLGRRHAVHDLEK